MAVSGVSGGSESTAAAADAAVARKTGNQALGKDDFMKLLTAQLKNQDPNNPTDTKELVTQLSQLSSVEQLTQLNSKMDALSAATNSSNANSSSALIGKTVKGVADTTQLGDLGGGNGSVNLAQNASSVKVSVVNASGRVVSTIDMGALSAGQQAIKWDGNEDSGDRASPGIYTFQVAAKDGAGNPVEASQSVSGTVTGVYYENGAPELQISNPDGSPGTRMPLSNLTSISQ